MSSSILSILSGVAGILLGFGSSYILLYFKYHSDISTKLIDQYIAARNAIADEIAPLVIIPHSRTWTTEDRLRQREAIICLYYKYYDFFPQSVLDALSLLEIAIGDPSHGPYTARGNKLDRLHDHEIPPFLVSVARFDQIRAFSVLTLASTDPNRRGNEVIRLHARYVLKALNDHASPRGLARLAKRLQKPVGRISAA